MPLYSFACCLLSWNMYLTQSIYVAMEAFNLSCCWAPHLNSVLWRQKTLAPYKAFSAKDGNSELPLKLNSYWTGDNTRSPPCILDAYH